VLRRLRAHDAPSVVVQIGEDLRIVIPCWMLDEPFCQSLTLEERPRIGIEALRRLRRLVDEQLSASNEKATRGSIVEKGDLDESQSNNSKTTNNSTSPTTT